MTERLSLSMEKQTYRTDLSTWAGEGEEGKDEMFGKRNMETYITICKIDSQQGICCMAKETQTGALYQPRGLERGGRLEGGSRERGHMYTYGSFMLIFDRK